MSNVKPSETACGKAEQHFPPLETKHRDPRDGVMTNDTFTSIGDLATRVLTQARGGDE